MTDREPTRPRLGEWHEPDQEAYHAVSGLAVSALVIGVLSVVALVDPLAALVPFVGVVVGGVALVRIARRSPELVGRKAAVIGLCLSLLFGTISLGRHFTYRWLLACQAERVGMAWFELVARGEPQLAHQLTLVPDQRQPRGGDDWAAYRRNKKLHEAMEKYLSDPLLRTLLALGRKATVRLYATEKIAGPAGQEGVSQLYAVTFEQDGRKTTFLVRLFAQRMTTQFADREPWRVAGTEGGVRPAWEAPPGTR